MRCARTNTSAHASIGPFRPLIYETTHEQLWNVAQVVDIDGDGDLDISHRNIVEFRKANPRLVDNWIMPLAAIAPRSLLLWGRYFASVENEAEQPVVEAVVAAFGKVRTDFVVNDPELVGFRITMELTNRMSSFGQPFCSLHIFRCGRRRIKW